MIRRPNKKFDIAGDDYFFAIGGINDIEVVWWGFNDLTVIYEHPVMHIQERILRQQTMWGDGRISYREKPRNEP